jgi:hypothetical protein
MSLKSYQKFYDQKRYHWYGGKTAKPSISTRPKKYYYKALKYLPLPILTNANFLID